MTDKTLDQILDEEQRTAARKAARAEDARMRRQARIQAEETQRVRHEWEMENLGKLSGPEFEAVKRRCGY
jgi:hypothetical protein